MVTEKRLEFWKLWVLGYQEKEIALELGIELSGVKSRKKGLYDRLYEKTRIQNINKSKSTGIYHREISEFYNRLLDEIREMSSKNTEK